MRTPHQYATSEIRAVELMYGNKEQDYLIVSKEQMLTIMENAYIEGAIKSRMR